MIVDVIFSYEAFVLLFYVAVVSLIYFKRDLFEFEGIIALYKTEYGLNKMEEWAERYPRVLKWLGVLGIIFGYFLMVLMTWLIIESFKRVFTRPDAPPALSPILPGVEIPGTGAHLPLVEGLIAIFIVIVIHEFAHGVICRLYDINVKSSGLVLFGPLPGAFVEPDEDELDDASWTAAQSMFGAGPFSNILLGIPIFLLLTGGVIVHDAAYDDLGVQITEFSNESQVLDGLEENQIITQLDNTTISDTVDLRIFLQNTQPNQTVSVITTEGQRSITLKTHPTRDIGYMGIIPVSVREPSDSFWSFISVAPSLFTWFFGDFSETVTAPWQWIIVNPFGAFQGSMGLLGWMWLVTTGVAGANLLPIGPLDGGRMLFDSFSRMFGEVGEYIATGMTLVLFVMVIIALLRPIGRAIIT